MEGDEFMIVMPEINKQIAQKRTNYIRELIENEIIRYEDYEINVTISAGISAYTYDCLDYTIIIDNADKALYEAKNRGRNQVVVY